MNIGDVFLAVRADLSQFQASLAGLNSQVSRSATSMGKDLMKVGAGMTRTGTALTRNLTVPILAAGGAVAHFALDFDTAMRRIVGLAKVPQSEIQGVRDSILKMAADVGRSPQDLAEAFYFVASAGFKADEAMKVLETSATASAAGMGEVQDVAKVLGGVINAYGHENLTAARAGDILTAAIQDGAAEASDFSVAIGQVVPMAAAMGVSFDQVTAAMSAMTNVGIDAETSAVNLGQIFSALLKPTSEANDALKEVGLSAAGLRDELREKGLLATLRTMQTAFEGNDVAFSKVFGNIRALRGINALLGLDEQQLNAIFKDTAEAVGTLAQAYEDTDGPQRQIDKAFASMQADAISLGKDVLPSLVEVIKEMAAGLRRLARWWADLSAETKQSILHFLAFAAVIGPILVVVGKLVSGLGALIRVIGFLMGAKGIPALIGGISKARIATGLWVIAIIAVAEAAQAVNGPISDFFDTLVNGKKANRTLHDLLELTGDMAKSQYLRAMGIDAKEFAQAVEKAGGDVTYAFDAIKDAGGDLGKALDYLSAHSDEVGQALGVRMGRNLKEARAAAKAAGEGIVTDLEATLVEGQFVVGPAAQEGEADPIVEALEKAKQKVADAAKDLLHTLASVLSSNPKELQDAANAMIDDILHPFPDAQHKLEILGILARGIWVTGLTSPDSGDRARTAEYIEGLLTEFETLAPGVLATGEGIPPALQAGINRTLDSLTTYLNDTVVGGITDKFELADELQRMGYVALAAYVRGMEIARIAKLTNEIANTVNQVKHDLGYTTDIYYAGRLITSEWMRGLLDGIKENKYLLSIAMWDIRNHFGHSLPTKGPLAGDATWRGGVSIGGQWIEGMVYEIADGLRAIKTTVGLVGSALMPTASLMPAMAGLSTVSSVSSAQGLNQATSLTISGGIHFHDVGNDVSPERAREHAQEILDIVANGLQEESSRFPNRPGLAG